MENLNKLWITVKWSEKCATHAKAIQKQLPHMHCTLLRLCHFKEEKIQFISYSKNYNRSHWRLVVNKIVTYLQCSKIHCTIEIRHLFMFIYYRAVNIWTVCKVKSLLIL